MTQDQDNRDATVLSPERRSFIGGIGKAGATVIALSAFGAGFVANKAFAQDGLPQKVMDVLNFALTLEYLENEFYQVGLGTRGLIPGADRAIFQQIANHETAHVNLLKTVLGSAAVAKPNFDFTVKGAFNTFGDYAIFQALAQGLEDTGVRAYKGQATELIDFGDVLTTALQIHSVEARHAAEVRRLRGFKGWITGSNVDVAALQASYAGEEVTSQLGIDLGASTAAGEAFDEPLTKDQVLAIAGQFIV